MNITLGFSSSVFRWLIQQTFYNTFIQPWEIQSFLRQQCWCSSSNWFSNFLSWSSWDGQLHACTVYGNTCMGYKGGFHIHVLHILTNSACSLRACHYWTISYTLNETLHTSEKNFVAMYPGSWLQSRVWTASWMYERNLFILRCHGTQSGRWWFFGCVSPRNCRGLGCCGVLPYSDDGTCVYRHLTQVLTILSRIVTRCLFLSWDPRPGVNTRPTFNRDWH